MIDTAARTSGGAKRRSRLRTALVAGLVGALSAASAVALSAAPAQAADCSAGYVALTFDDGPNPSSTMNLLNALKSNGLRATMFNVGQNVQNNPSLARAQVEAGMWVANHSWSHPYLTQMNYSQVQSELQRTQQAIQQATGVTPRLFRPPYGSTNGTVQSVAQQLGLREIIWDVDSQDWNGASTAQIVQRASSLQNGQVILMHDNYASTIAAIPQIAANLRSRNLCAGMISPTTGRAVAPDDAPPTSPSPSPAIPSPRITPSPSPSPSPAIPSPRITPSPSPSGGTGSGSCRVSYSANSWNTGFTSNIKITNTGTTPINGWTLTFTFPSGQQITQGWSATYAQSGSTVTAQNVSWNGTLNPGQSADIGFNGSHNGTNTDPTSFSLNGQPCSS